MKITRRKLFGLLATTPLARWVGTKPRYQWKEYSVTVSVPDGPEARMIKAWADHRQRLEEAAIRRDLYTRIAFHNNAGGSGWSDWSPWSNITNGQDK